MKDDDLYVNFTPFPRDYDQQAMNLAFRSLEIFLNKLTARGSIRVSNINVSDLPTSATGLRSGDLWSDGGTVKVVS